MFILYHVGTKTETIERDSRRKNAMARLSIDILDRGLRITNFDKLNLKEVDKNIGPRDSHDFKTNLTTLTIVTYELEFDRFY